NRYKSNGSLLVADHFPQSLPAQPFALYSAASILPALLTHTLFCAPSLLFFCLRGVSGFVYPRPHAGALRTRLGTDDNPYLLLALEGGAVQQQHDQQQELHNEVTGTVDNPHVVSDSEHTEEDEDDGLGLVNLSDVDVDEDMVDQAIQDATAVAVAAAADHIISAGQDGQPPAYTMPSFRKRGDDFLGAISVMQDATRRFRFGARSAWALNKFGRTDFDNMASAQVRSLARQLLAAADGDISHPIIRRNAVYSACIRRYQLL
ncbi:unnamed protein product, partial [Tilletia caries]